MFKKHPKLAETQGVGCFYSIDDATKASNLLFQKPILGQQPYSSRLNIDPIMANNLFIGS